MVKLAFDAGHGLYTSGKQTPDGEKEWSFNNAVLNAFANELKKYYGIEMLRVDDPTGKVDVPLKQRTDKANSWKADYYISFHHNANTSKWGTWTGVETFVYDKTTNPKSIGLANAIHPALVKGYGLRDRGIKRGNLHIVRETNCAAILVEGGFMDSTIDIKVLRDKAKLENSGRLMAQAFAKYTNLKLKEVEKVVVKEKDNTVSKWAKEGVEWAIKNNISDGSRPKDAVTREEVMTMLHRMSKLNK